MINGNVLFTSVCVCHSTAYNKNTLVRRQYIYFVIAFVFVIYSMYMYT